MSAIDVPEVWNRVRRTHDLMEPARPLPELIRHGVVISVCYETERTGMHLTKLALAAAVTLFAINSAAAAPIAPSKPEINVSSMIEVQHRRYATPPPNARGHRYVPGRRYSTAPHGWRRYGTRPGNWRSLGCVMVGPVWFCP
jgi:hypothetical protein